MANPELIKDFVKAKWTIIPGVAPGASMALTCIVAEFEASDAFPDRTMIIAGSLDSMQAELISIGFATTSATYKRVTKFMSQEAPLDAVMIGRRDPADASWTATMTAINAEDSSFLFFAAETRTKAEQLELKAWAEPRWKFYLTITREPGTLTKAAGTLAATAYALKYQHSAAIYHVAADATGYGPATIMSAAPNANVGGFNISNGQTLKFNVTGGATQTATFNATVPSVTGNQTGPTFALAAAEHLDLRIDTGSTVVLTLVDDPAYFPDGIAAATAAQLAKFFGELLPVATFSSVGGALKISSQRAGTLAKVQIMNTSTAGLLTDLGLSAGTTSGTGDFEFADRALASELATVINADTAGVTASAVGTKLKIISDTSGEEVYIEILEGEVLAELGIETGKYYGTGTEEDWLDCQMLGYGAELATRLDNVEGHVSWDNTKLQQAPGAVLTETARKNCREQNCNTYEERTSQYPGELHWGVVWAGFNIEDVVFGFWYELRLSEEVKATQDRYTKLKKKIPLDQRGIDIYATCIKKVTKQGALSNALSFADIDPFADGKQTGLYIPTMKDQKSADLAVGKIGGFKTTQQLSGAAKAVEYEIVFQTPTNS